MKTIFTHTTSLTAGLLLGTVLSYAAGIHGIVKDATTGEPLIGATIQIEGAKEVAVTGGDGIFEISNASFPCRAKVSYVGYTPYDVLITADRADDVEVDLKEDSKVLDEIVVVGYGTQRRTQLTGSVTKVGGDQIDKSLSLTLDGALSGAVAGLGVTTASGQPGASSSVRIRGGNSVNASNEPLYVIDGFIYYKDANAANTGLGAIESDLNPLATINPSDIESVEVLKDVSATAIYGSRGSNGVVIVTTRKGKAGKPRVTYRLTAGFDDVVKHLKLMDASQWARFQKDYFNNKGGYTDEEIAALGKGTDWQDATLRKAFRQSHELSVSGGSEHNIYAFSASYTDQDGIIINSGFKRYNFHLNTEWKVLDNLRFGVNATYGKSTQNGLTTTQEVTYNSSPFSADITNSFVYALLTPTVVNIYNPDGSYNYSNPYEYAYFAIGSAKSNAVSDLENSVAQNINSYLLSNVWAQYAVGDLIIKASLGLNKEHITQNYFSPSYTSLGLANNGLGGIGNRHNEIWQQELTATWSRQLNSANYIDVLVGYTRQESRTNFNSVLTTHFTNETLKHNNLADGSEVYPPISGESKSTLNSAIARVNYTLNNRYNATVTFRADNSSRFARNHRWGYFPSIGLSWNIDKEPFLRDITQITSLKLRASAGSVGNQEIPDYAYSLSFTAGQYDGSSSYSKTSDANNNLTWETTDSYNVGVDISLWDNKVWLTAEAYYKKTRDLLLEVPVGFSQGVTTQMRNVGNVENKGVEFSGGVNIIQTKNLRWNVTANIAYNHNCLTASGTDTDVILGASNQNVLRKGEALGSFYGLVFDGIVQADEDLASLPLINGARPTVGSVKFVDVDKNGRIDDNDRVVLGSSQPKFIYGFSTLLGWKRFDLSATFAGNYGNKVFNSLGRRLELTGDSYNVLAALTGSWTPQNPSNRYPNPELARSTSLIDSRYVEDASYLKLRNLTLGYNIPLPATSPVSLRVFATANNLFTITKYSGYDPEVSSGTDTGAYPAARSFIFGFEVSL